MKIEVQGLTKNYGSVEAVNGVSLTLNPGDFVGFIGGNGVESLHQILGQLIPSVGVYGLEGGLRCEPSVGERIG